MSRCTLTVPEDLLERCCWVQLMDHLTGGSGAVDAISLPPCGLRDLCGLRWRRL